MGIKSPFISEIARNTYAINEFGLTAMYLIVGDEKAVLLDTGCGVSDVKGIVEKLTDKPYQVILTHGHLDHVGGMGNFDEIYIGKEDFDMAKDLDYDRLRDYNDNLGKMGSYDVYDFKPEVSAPHKIPVMHEINDGDVISLGNRDLLIIKVPGHTPGGLVVLDDKERILFSGDACNNNLLATGTPVSETYKALKRLETFRDRYDQMYNGHLGYAGVPECLAQPDSILPDLLHICEAILSGTATPKEFPFLGRTLSAMEYGNARLSYDPENL